MVVRVFGFAFGRVLGCQLRQIRVPGLAIGLTTVYCILLLLLLLLFIVNIVYYCLLLAVLSLLHYARKHVTSENSQCSTTQQQFAQ